MLFLFGTCPAAACGTAVAPFLATFPAPPKMSPIESDLEREILKYLLDNPEGKDTIQGIARFWIMGHQIDRIVDALQDAIGVLVERGYLNEKTIPASKGKSAEHYYELNGSRIGEIAEMVKKERPVENQ